MNEVIKNTERPKRLLSIDGGGIRGIIAAEILIEIESIICSQTNSPWNCLADYFDFIGGTSTGAILAAGLAKGMKAQQLLDFYENEGKRIFKRNLLSRTPLIGQLWTKYRSKPLETKLREIFVNSHKEDLKLGSSELKTLLMIVSKNVTNGSTWFFVSSPKNKYYSTNSQIPLWQIIRGSSAAPTYFPPQIIQAYDKKYEFVDGGMSMFNNPSFQLFLEATKKEYNIGWERGEKKILLVSIGTGYGNLKIPFQKAGKYTALDWASYAVTTLMNDANWQQNLIMNLISPKPKLQELDRKSTLLKSSEVSFSPLLTYHRYNISFKKERFEKLDELYPDLNLKDIDLQKVESLDCIDQIPELRRIGRAVAMEQVEKTDFDNFYDV